MGRELYEADAVFRGAFDAICGQLDIHLDKPLKDVVFAKGNKAAALLDDTTYAQPALFAVEVALFEALSKRGLKPALLAGHSIGEIAAAHVAGVFDLADAAKLVAARGRLMGALPEGGAMAAIEATEEEVAGSIEGREEQLAIAAVNGPTAIVISGAEAAVEEVRAGWEEEGRRTKRLAVSHAFHSPLMEPMLEEFAAVAESLAYSESKIPVVSNLTGETLSSEDATDPAYWVRHVREPVRFADAVSTLRKQGATTYLELGPDPVLCAMARECLGEEAEAAFVPTLREGREEAGAATNAIAAAHVAGAKVDWGAFFAGTGAKRVPLPSYPFQRKRYWLRPALVGTGDLTAAGQASADHPLLGAAVELAAGEGLLLTGRLSLADHPWLVDHVVVGAVLVPGAAFLELALRAAGQIGAETVEELTLRAPLVLPETGAVAIQVTVSGPGDDGRREIGIHSRAEGGEDEGPAAWTRHAEGVLSSEPAQVPETLDAWPPEGAEPVEVEYLYDLLAEHGIEYGPAFQSLTAAWLAGEEIFAELALPEEQAQAAARFGIHPALLDSGLHSGGLAKRGSAEIEVPRSWRRAALHAAGAAALRLRLVPDGEAYGVEAFDADGAPVFSAASVAMRPFEPGEARAARQRRSLYAVRWRALPASSIDDAPEETLAIVSSRGQGAGDLAEAALTTVASTLASLQGWVAEERPPGARLALVTERAVAAGDGETPDLAVAGVWGLVRSVMSEHPGRFALVDTDGTEASEKALPAALAMGAEEPQLALREGELLVPRLARIDGDEEEGRARPLDPERTVLITGGLSGLGALVARRLAERHGARRLLLVSRSGAEAKGAAELRAELEELGAEVTIAACDVADRDALERLFASIPDAHPLDAIVHSAGALADGVLESMDAARLERTMRPKATAAWHLHELSRDLDLSQFVMFSSAAGLLGGAAQANYAAANDFLDALAAVRRAEDLPATSLAWGLWEQRTSLAGEEVDLASMERIANQIRERLGFARMDPEQGLELFDAARELPEPMLAPVHFDAAVLRDHARAGSLAPILRELVRTRAPRAGQSRSLAQRLAELPASRREAAVLDLVRSQVAAVLGQASAGDVEPGKALQELGFDSLAAVELRNRLSGATGIALPATLVFDYPSAAAIASWLLAEAGAAAPAEGELREAEIREQLARLEATLSSLDPADEVRERAGTRLRSLLVGLSDSVAEDGDEPAEDLASMSHEEMFELIDEEFGGESSDGG